MKVVDFDNPVHYSWFADQGRRLDASSYLSGAYEARKLLEQANLPKEPLHMLTTGPEGGIYNGPKFRRIYVSDRSYGVPFMGSTDMLEADFSWLPLLSKKYALQLPHLEVRPGTTLISCSGTVGRTAFVRPDMEGFWSSQHVMKVTPNPQRVPPGYLNAYLQSRFGVSIISGSAYGAIIQHIEPQHIANLPVPRLDSELENKINALIQDAAQLRANFQSKIQEATRDLFTSAGVPELADYSWHQHPRDLGFCVTSVDTTTLRAFNFSPRTHQIIDKLKSVPHKTLGDICQGGQLSRGNRFKRIDGDPAHGVRLVGQRQGFWIRPEGRWVILNKEDLAMARVSNETVLIASQGTLGENEVFCRALFVTGSWQRNFVFSEHFLRIQSGDPDFPGAYLFALLRSEAIFRVLRSMSTGGKQQDIHEELRKEIPVPICTPEDRKRIAETVRQAYRDRDEADRREDEALRLLEEAIREAAR
ncbi:methylation-associated defense system restriction endonuclease subunit S MAD5 [uncultured Thermomonospora sp.]|uniref:methylation-associated defense system restriction endonuclease subunit S MAD5 n=1 Tax=uncultured Thermomonospora sp. TaxID=671175 RepID=UPI00259BBB2B|nr:hypothetical protein [uncultured Thermomonospora sp.]